jgi:uncharacterized membrane protein (UPF0136 family)
MKIFKNKFGQIALLSTVAVGSASAAVAEGVTTAISTAGTDAAVVGAAMLVVLVGIRAFKLLRKAL